MADADKDKLWLVVPTADTGVEEVAHFKPAGDTTVFTMTAADHTYGSGLHLVGTDKADRLGHLEPKTNLHDIYWEDTLDTYYMEFQDGTTSPFDYSNYTAGLSLYFRVQGATGNWRRVFLAQQSDDNEFSSAEGVANHFVGGTVYDVIIRATSTTAGVHSVSSVPSTIRLEPHPGGGSFRSLVDEDELGQITTVTQEVRQVDGEVNDFTLAYASGTLTGTVERSIGADLVATAAIPEGLAPRWRNDHGRPDCRWCGGYHARHDQRHSAVNHQDGYWREPCRAHDPPRQHGQRAAPLQRAAGW